MRIIIGDAGSKTVSPFMRHIGDAVFNPRLLYNGRSGLYSHVSYVGT